jgi:hypothetical protein
MPSPKSKKRPCYGVRIVVAKCFSRIIIQNLHGMDALDLLIFQILEGFFSFDLVDFFFNPARQAKSNLQLTMTNK